MNDMTYSMTGDMSHLCGELSTTARVAFGYAGNRSEGDTAVFRTPQVAGASLLPAMFENGQFVVEASGNLIDGGAGDDYISAGTGADIAHGDEGHDDITGVDGADVLFGDAGDDFIQGDGSSDPSRTSTDHSYVPASLHGDHRIVYANVGTRQTRGLACVHVAYEFPGALIGPLAGAVRPTPFTSGLVARRSAS